jgi:hypothetical protein
VSSVEVVRALAEALDLDDFETVAGLIADDCEYPTGRALLRGPSAIVASYREATEWGRRHLDSVRYESVVEPLGPDTIAVRFIDHLVKGERAHRHECRQVFTVGAGGRVVRIEHHDLPGERGALLGFFRSCGLER